MQVSPNILEFKGTFTKQITQHLTLVNSSDGPLAFKVKTTSPKIYCVRPNASIIQAGESVSIAIILQAFAQKLPEGFKCKDKFLVVSVPCVELKNASEVSQKWAELESNHKKYVVSQRLRVFYTITETDSDAGSETKSNGTPNLNTTHHDEADQTYNNTVFDEANMTTIGGNNAPSAERTITEPPASPMKKTENAPIAAPASEPKEMVTNMPQPRSIPKQAVLRETEPSNQAPEAVNGLLLPFAAILIVLAFLLGWLVF